MEEPFPHPKSLSRPLSQKRNTVTPLLSSADVARASPGWHTHTHTNKSHSSHSSSSRPVSNMKQRSFENESGESERREKGIDKIYN